MTNNHTFVQQFCFFYLKCISNFRFSFGQFIFIWCTIVHTRNKAHSSKHYSSHTDIAQPLVNAEKYWMKILGHFRTREKSVRIEEKAS